MIKGLRIAYENQYLLYSVLQIFILQPGSNWKNLAITRMQEEGGNCDPNYSKFQYFSVLTDV